MCWSPHFLVSKNPWTMGMDGPKVICSNLWLKGDLGITPAPMEGIVPVAEMHNQPAQAIMRFCIHPTCNKQLHSFSHYCIDHRKTLDLILYDAKRTLTTKQVGDVKFQIRDNGRFAKGLIDKYNEHQRQQMPGNKRRKFNISHVLLDLIEFL